MSLIGAAFLLPGVAAADTRAGARIVNVATLTARDGDGERTLPSNPVSLTVAERLDVALTRTDDAVLAVAPGGVAVPLLLVNRGNGLEAFDLVALPSDTSARVRLIAIDRDGDGRFDAAIDTPLADGRTPELEPGATLRLLVVLDPAAAEVTATTLTAVARAATGSGPAGTMFATRGDGGSDAVTGSTDARAEVVVPLGTEATAAPVLVKSQSVRAPDGSTNPVTGAVVTYRLEARFAAATAAARIADPIPVGTAYVPGSLTLDAAALSDAGGDDAGEGDPRGIAVDLGDVAAAATRTVTFQVTIQ
ncbi:hypothetical protein M9979_04225 [Sphingomonas sp. RP10(2022)]|uniref:DUF11 domain-containing protein n=1 Tax=Sphingomonas liriopis TaxID=2949094 RepID=A0A9X2KPN7_9SPHN|nr:hypothetical protein [Sphingomonas liriopis]MCP3734082.1 hypothetical protein [Sphingomonas liriopis]